MEFIDESKYHLDYHKRKRKCNKHGCDTFAINFTNDIGYCDDCFYNIKYPDKIARTNLLEEYRDSDPVRLIQALKKERDRILQLEEILETQDEEIVSMETIQEQWEENERHHYESYEENEYLTEQNSQLQEQVDELQDQLQEMEEHECQKCNAWNEKIQ